MAEEEACHWKKHYEISEVSILGLLLPSSTLAKQLGSVIDSSRAPADGLHSQERGLDPHLFT